MAYLPSFQDNVLNNASHWNNIRGALDSDSPCYDDTVASGKDRRVGQLMRCVWIHQICCESLPDGL